MANLTKRTVEALEPSTEEYTVWDDRLKGLGVRVFPSGTRKFILKYRNHSGLQRKLTLGTFPVVTADRARELALKHLADVSEGGDPSANKQEKRKALTVAELCDAYFEACDAGLVLGRRGLPKKASTLYVDKGRSERHIKPLLGKLKARDVKRADIERFKAAVVTGKTAADIKTKLHGRAIVKGGKGTATRTLGLLGAIFKWGLANGHVETNPVAGVQRFADNQRKALLTPEQYRMLGSVLDALATKRDRNGNPVHHAFGLACIRFIALTGLRKGEANTLRWSDVDLSGCCLRLGDTKTGASIRPIGAAIRTLLQGLERHGEYVFPLLARRSAL